MLVGRRFFFVRPFPLLQIPNFETTAPTDECNFALQTELLAKILRQDQAPLPIRCTMFRARMQLTRKDSAISRGYCVVGLGLRAHAGELLPRHDQEILVVRFGQDDEIFTLILAPAGWNGDAVFFVDGMTKLAGKEFFGLRVGVHPPASRSILIHFAPLLTTSRKTVSIKNKQK